MGSDVLVVDQLSEIDVEGDRCLERFSGRLPAALRALMTHVGGISLMGDLPQLGLVYDAAEGVRTMPPGPPFADPLVIAGIEGLEYELIEYRDDVDPNEHDPLILFAFAPDELHKANISGGEHTVSLPSRAPDPVIAGIAGRPGITLIDYLRLSSRGEGCPVTPSPREPPRNSSPDYVPTQHSEQARPLTLHTGLPFSPVPPIPDDRGPASSAAVAPADHLPPFGCDDSLLGRPR